jgi:hypothetical protein
MDVARASAPRHSGAGWTSWTKSASASDQQDDPGTALEKKDKSAMIESASCFGGTRNHRPVYYHEKSVGEIVGIPENTVRACSTRASAQTAELKRLAMNAISKEPERHESEALRRGMRRDWPPLIACFAGDRELARRYDLSARARRDDPSCDPSVRHRRAMEAFAAIDRSAPSAAGVPHFLARLPGRLAWRLL